MPTVSVVIVTKNRVNDLQHCLGALLSNSRLPDEIIIIDNDSTDNTQSVIFALQKNVTVPMHYILFNGNGYPALYNQGLLHAQSDWVAFIDDDCVAGTNWLEELYCSIRKHPTVAAIMGWCETYYSTNVYSQATVLFEHDWKNRSIEGNIVRDLEVLDTKNIAYNAAFLKKHSIQYDEQRTIIQNGAAQDCDMGIQIQKLGGRAVCNKNMVLHHKDATDWMQFMKKRVASIRAYESLNSKWDMKSRTDLKKHPKKLSVVVSEFANDYELSSWSKAHLLFICKHVTYLQRLFRIISRVPPL